MKFFKATANTGPHTGALWSSTGSLLATATFTSESKSGWQTAFFATPVPIQAGQTYVASYHAPAGHYTRRTGIFANGKTFGSSLLVASAGVYGYGDTTRFPTSTWHSSSYFVDVLLAPTGSPFTAEKNRAGASRATAVTAPSSRATTAPSRATTAPPTTAPPTTAPPTTAPPTGKTSTTSPSSVKPPTTQAAKPAAAAPVGAPTTGKPAVIPTPSQVTPRTTAPPAIKPAVTAPSNAVPAVAVRTGCVARPSACGYPDATNTGVSSGTVLKPSGSLSLTTPGEVVSGLNITGCVSIRASNVTLKNSVVHGNCPGTAVVAVSYSGVSGVVIDHVEIDGGNTSPSSPGLTGAGFTAAYLKVHGTGDGINVQNNDYVHDSYIYGLHVAAGDHTDGIQSAGGSNSSVVHNTVIATCTSCNSAMIIGADLADIGTFTASNNLLDGGGFTVFAGTGGYDSGSITFIGNRFGNGYKFGSCSLDPSPGRIIGWPGNVRDTDGAALSC